MKYQHPRDNRLRGDNRIQGKREMTTRSRKIESTIDSVVLYQNGCQVSRVTTVDLEAGMNLLELAPLPRQVDKESFRITGNGPGTVLNTIVKRGFSEKEIKQDVQKLIDQLKQLDSEIKEINEKIAFSNTCITQLKDSLRANTSKFPMYLAIGREAYQGYMNLDESITGKIQAFLQEIGELKGQLSLKQEQVDQLKKQLHEVNTGQDIIEFTQVLITMEVESPGTFDLEIHYVFKSASKASWHPFYEIFLAESGETALLKMNAMVNNNTGEDWRKVGMVLSTASLAPVRINEPDPFLLRVRRPRPPPRPSMAPQGGGRMMKKKAMGMMPKEDMKMEIRMEEEEEAEAPMEPEMERVEIEVSENVGIQTYKLNTKVDIDSGKTSGPFFLKDISLETKVEYFWSPGQQEMVVARNIVTNDSTVILPGKIRTFIDEEFTGISNLDLISPHEEFKIGLREAKNVKIRKQVIDRGRKKKGMVIKGKISRRYKFSLTIDILIPTDGTLILKDVIPHSDAETIKVENVEFSLEPNEQEVGILEWKLPTNEKKKTEIQYEFEIRHPRHVIVHPPLP
ncbi:mucoidy inhibitor MuiA family protein [Candidatus Bathyarchaeota archaeon]|nr:mucoidy inhibitor MuiA family protein [Candidatus Bathyarchaeota archaeon]